MGGSHSYELACLNKKERRTLFLLLLRVPGL